jgi:Ca2+:H+ antiporter
MRPILHSFRDPRLRSDTGWQDGRMKALGSWFARWWTVVVPVVGVVVLVIFWAAELNTAAVIFIAVVLAGTVLAAVQHAEVVAHRVGEPFGSLVLAVAVTVIEVALIVTLMTTGKDSPELARDTVFSAVMITMNGIVGLSLLLSASRRESTAFNAQGSGAALATVTALATLTLVLPSFTSTPGPVFSPPQLVFAAVASIALYAMFVFTQTVAHRDYFLPVGNKGQPLTEDDHAAAPSNRTALISLGLLFVSLVAVVGLAKLESTPIERAVTGIGLPQSFVGVVIALLVLLPEGIAAAKAANRNRTQTSLNLALGSAMASIGLTIPAIAVASIWLSGPLDLGLGGTQIVLLAITTLVGALTVLPGRATVQEGGVHLVLFAAFLFLAIRP